MLVCTRSDSFAELGDLGIANLELVGLLDKPTNRMSQSSEGMTERTVALLDLRAGNTGPGLVRMSSNALLFK